MANDFTQAARSFSRPTNARQAMRQGLWTEAEQRSMGVGLDLSMLPPIPNELPDSVAPSVQTAQGEVSNSDRASAFDKISKGLERVDQFGRPLA